MKEAHPPIRAARWAIAAVFCVNGALLATWVSRIPAVKDALGLSDGQLGLALFGIAVGALLSFPVAGRIVPRFGSRRVTVAAGLALGAVLVSLAAVASLWRLVPLLALFGAANGVLDVAMNAQGVEVERESGRSIMGSLHGMFSLGGLAGAAVGGWSAGRGLTPLFHFGVVGGITTLLLVLIATRLLPSAPAAAREAGDRPVFARPNRALLGLGLIACCAFLSEGAVADWSAVYLRDTLRTSAAYAAAGYAAFSLAMTAARFGGDALVTRLGPARLVASGGLIAAIGLGGALLVGKPMGGVIGFACVGAGMANVAPLVFSAAGRTPGVAPGAGIAAVATMGYGGFLAGPAAIGFLAENVTLRAALGVVVVLGCVIARAGKVTFCQVDTPGG